MSAALNKPLDIKKSLIDMVLAGLLALIVFGPIVGIVLDGYSFNLQPARVAWLVLIVMIGRFSACFCRRHGAGPFPTASKAPAPGCMCCHRTTRHGCASSSRR
jgi:hypothetical protein